MPSLVLQELAVRRRTLLSWALGLAFFAVIYMLFWPAVSEEMADIDIESIDLYRSMGVTSMSDFLGYMQSTVFNIVPILVGAFGVALGASALAGEEGDGTLENLAALPVSRLQLFSAKTLALIAATLVVILTVACLLGISFLFIESDVEADVSAIDLFLVMISSWLIAFVFLALSLFLGAYLPSRGSALTVGFAVLIGAFFFNNIADMVSGLDVVQPLSPFYHYQDVSAMLTDEVSWSAVGVLLGMAVLPLVLGVFAFQRRDLMVGAWPWQRPRPGGESVMTAADGSTVSTRRFRAPQVVAGLALLALLGLCCVASVGAGAIALSDDLRADVEDLVGLGGVVFDGEAVVEEEAVVRADDTGWVLSVPVEVGDEVESGDTVVVLIDRRDAALTTLSSRLLEQAWAFTDELAAGGTDVDVGALDAEAEAAALDAEAADRAVREARAADVPGDEVEALERLASLALARLELTEARLALAEGRISPEDVAALDNAILLADEPSPEPDEEDAETERATRRILEAPIAGTVAEILERVGAGVQPDDPLVRIAPSGGTLIVFRVSEEDADELEAGDELEIEVEDVDDVLVGRIVSLAEIEDEDRDDEADTAAGEDSEDDGDADDAVDDEGREDADDEDADDEDADDEEDDDEDDELTHVVRVFVDDPYGDIETDVAIKVRTLDD